MSENDDEAKFVKIVYFDEESASDLLDISAGGKLSLSAEQARERVAEIEANAGIKAAAKFNWLPFLGASAEAGAAASASAIGRNILNKTLSNTILTDYLEKLPSLVGVERITTTALTAREGSAAHTKMFTPYMAMLKMDDLPLNLSALDQALKSAKGYYELLGEDANSEKSILRFNIQAFRNNYGLVDLGRMELVFHGVKVGKATESSLSMEAEMAPNGQVGIPTVQEIAGEESAQAAEGAMLDVYDILLAGVEHAV